MKGSEYGKVVKYRQWGYASSYCKEARSGNWYKFSDALVEPLEGKNPKLGNEINPLTETNGNKSRKKIRNGSKSQKVPKGWQASHNAYMLVYMEESTLKAIREEEQATERRREELRVNFQKFTEKPVNTERADGRKTKNPPAQLRRKVLPENCEDENTDFVCVNGLVYPVSFPLYLRAYIEQDRRILDEEIREAQARKEEKLTQRITLRKRMREICANLTWEPKGVGDAVAFIPTEWLSKFLSDPGSLNEMVTSDLLCMHGKLDIDKVSRVKAVNPLVAENLYQEAKGVRGPRLTRQALCGFCVRNICRKNDLVRNSAADAKELVDDLKQTVASDMEAFWVGKTSLKKWRQIAKRKLEDEIIHEANVFADVTNKPEGAAIVDLVGRLETSKNGERERGDSGNSNLCDFLKATQSKLSKVGTNVSLVGDASKIGTQADDDENNNAESKGSGMSNPADHDKYKTIATTRTKANGKASHGAKDEAANGSNEGTSLLRVHCNTDENGSPIDEFNGDIICMHGDLCPVEGKRKLVSEKVWRKLHSYFPWAPEFPRGSKTCSTCAISLGEEALDQERRKDVAHVQRNALQDILNERNRPTWAKATMDKVFLIPRSFVEELRCFVNKPLIFEPLTRLSNESLLCRHHGLLYPCDLDTESDTESVIYMVSEDEWSQLHRFFVIDHEIKVTRNRQSPECLSTTPNVCQDCVAARHEKEEQEKLCYKNLPVYVRQCTGEDKMPAGHETSDPDFAGVSNGTSGWKNKAASLQNGVTHQPVAKKVKLCHSTSNVRRSNRRQKVRGEKQITVSSDMLLRDLKVKIMELFKVAPFDQNLRLGQTILQDSAKTLAELKVHPYSTIYLKADELQARNGQTGEHEDSWGPGDPEEGFKGTGLVGEL